MAELFRIAVRNLLRHPRRTLITTGAVAFAVVAIAVAAGFVEFTSAGLRQSIVYGGLGHLQIRSESSEWRDRLDPKIVAKVDRLLSRDPAVEYRSARVEFQGLISSSEATLAVSGIGVDAAVEPRIRMLTMLTSGNWFLGTERVPKALLGKGLAEQLRVKPHDMVSLIAYSDRGRMTAADVQVAGVFESGVLEYDARTLLVPLRTAGELMETGGVSNLAVTLHDEAAAERLISRIERVLRGRPARIVPWRKLSPVYGSVVAMYQWILRAFMIVVGVIVMLGIANTMSMAVLERSGEVAILRALGFGGGRVLVMFLLEAVAIGALGAALGALLATGACQMLTRVGIDMPPPPGYSHGYVVRVPIVPRAFLQAMALATISAVVAGVGPAFRSIRGEVSDVLRAY
jgi:putative ABC transport system permease protein